MRVPPFSGADYGLGMVVFGVAVGAGRLVRKLEAQRLLLANALAATLREQAARKRAAAA